MATSVWLAAELELPQSVVEAALAHFERRGLVRPVSATRDPGCGTGSCGSCNLCFTAAPEAAWYRWCGASQSANPGLTTAESAGAAHGADVTPDPFRDPLR